MPAQYCEPRLIQYYGDILINEYIEALSSSLQLSLSVRQEQSRDTQLLLNTLKISEEGRAEERSRALHRALQVFLWRQKVMQEIKNFDINKHERVSQEINNHKIVALQMRNRFLNTEVTLF